MRMRNGAIFMIDDWQAIFIILYNIASFPQKKRKSQNFFSPLAIHTVRNPLCVHPKSGDIVQRYEIPTQEFSQIHAFSKIFYIFVMAYGFCR